MFSIVKCHLLEILSGFIVFLNLVVLFTLLKSGYNTDTVEMATFAYFIINFVEFNDSIFSVDLNLFSASSKIISSILLYDIFLMLAILAK